MAPRRSRIGRWMVSNTSSIVWTFVIGVLTTAALLPLHWDIVPIILIAAACLAIIVAIRPRAWVITIPLFVICSFMITTLAPLNESNSNVYFVRCSSFSSCLFTTEGTAFGGRYTIYPVVDPIKWMIWTRLTPSSGGSAVIQLGRFQDQVLFHSPAERAAIELNRMGGATNSELRLGARLGTLLVHMQENGTAQISYGIGGGTYLTWRAYDDIDRPGLFSTVGTNDRLSEALVESVRADSLLRALLQGRWVDVLNEVHNTPDLSLRSRLRNNLIEDLIMDRSLTGNVFDSLRWKSLREALPLMLEVKDRYSERDALFRTAVVAYTNMLRNPGGLGPSRQRRILERQDVALYDEDISNLFVMLGSIYSPTIGAGSDAERGRVLKEEWLENLGAPESITRDPEEALQLQQEYLSDDETETAFPSFEQLRERVRRAPNSNERDRIIYGAARQARQQIRLTEFMRMATRGASREQINQTFEEVSNTNRRSVGIVRQLAGHASPAGRVWIDAELRRGDDRMAQDAMTLRMLAMSGQEPLTMEQVYQIFEEEHAHVFYAADPEIAQRSPPPNWMIDYTGHCEWFDNRFKAHFLLQAVPMLASLGRTRENWEIAAARFWLDYGEGGRCPSFVPGLSVLHLALVGIGDQRSRWTRRRIDELNDADSAWMRYAFARMGERGAFVGQDRAARLASRLPRQRPQRVR